MDTHSHSPSSSLSFPDPLPSTSSSSIRPLSQPGDPPPCSASPIRKVTWKKRKDLLTLAQDESYRPDTTISILPENILLDMFDFYRNDDDNTRRFVWKWHILGHVCQRWRQIVLASPHRLNLRILCRRGTPVRKLLNIWPAFPIVLAYYSRSIRSNADEAIATLEHPGRVRNVTLEVTGPLLEKMVKAMHVSFPVLGYLHIMISPGVGHTLPCEFLGGSAPSLQEISLYGVPYPSLPRLLLSAINLVELLLRNIPPTGYISPEAIVVGLAALPRLKFFSMEFQSASSRPDRIPPPPATRTVLPSGIRLEFKCASEYLEGLVAQIDSPQLEWICINYFNELADFQAYQLSQFIDRIRKNLPR